jgi:hypothetical protein
MFRAVGFLIVLFGLSHFFSSAFGALDDTAVAVLETVEMSAQATQAQLEKKL